MTDGELRDMAVYYIKKTTISYPEWVKRCQDPAYNKAGSNWGRAFAALAAIPKV